MRTALRLGTFATWTAFGIATSAPAHAGVPACERPFVHTGTVELAVGSDSGKDTFGPYGNTRMRIDMIDVQLRADTLNVAWIEPVDNGNDRSLDVSGARASLPPGRQGRTYAAAGARVALILGRPHPTHVINTADYTVRGCLLPPTKVVERPQLEVPRRAPRVLTPREPVEQRAAPRQRPVGHR